MEIKKIFDKNQLKEKWKETEFYKTATFGSFKRSNKNNVNQISKFNENLSRLGLDANEQNKSDSNINKNFMSPQIILKLYQDKIAEQEKSRKDKEKRMRKIMREENKMLDFNKTSRTKMYPKKILINAKQK